MLAPYKDKPGQRRGADRWACYRPCLVRFNRMYLDGRAGSVGVQGLIRDLSACGVGLVLRPSVPPGSTLSVAPLGGEVPPLPSARVVRCVQVGGHWHHGCTWERRLTEKELRGWLT
jgi:hypothetical protein